MNWRDEEEEDEFLRRSVGIDRQDIQAEYAAVAGQLAFWTEQYAEAQGTAGQAKYALEVVEARMGLRHREILRQKVETGQLTVARGITEAMVREQVVLDPDYRAARLGLIEAEAAEARLNGIAKAVATKRDMLISLGAHVRAEMGLDPVIRAQAARDFAARGGDHR